MLFKSLSGKCRLNPVMYDNKLRQICFFRPLETILIGVAFFWSSNAAGIQDAGTHWLEIVQLEIRVNAGVDDAEELNEDGDVSLDSTDLELTYDDYHGGNQTIGLRFDDVQIDRAAKIHRAHIVFTVDEAESSNPCNLTFTAQAVDSAGPFTAEPHNITGRWPTTLARVTWSPPEWDTVGSAGYDQTTPGIASVIQEIIDRPGWVRGNSIVIIVTGTGSRVAESYDGSPDDAPLLHVEFGPADTDVDFKDYAVLANDWRRTGSALAADINADDVVDFNDLKILAASWLCGCDQIESYSPYSYSLYLACNQNVADASVNTFDLETLDYFRHFIAELENTGAIDMPIPVDMQDCNDPEYCPYIYLTTQEAKRILAAKTAHAIWLDKHDVLPWKIAQYSRNELAGLFDDDLLFSRSGSQYYYLSVVDHSPSEVFGYILDNELLKSDLFSTFYAILDDLRADFRHSNTSDDTR
ncbi:MAG: hypothetical protein OEW48_05220, partial [Phycisphaerae bacterium]|nr:hypothetical protein [Phycisphaerae bacterium]